MINPEPQEMRQIAAVCSQAPALNEWLVRWAKVELDRLPNALAANVAVAQGRCQVLKELVGLLRDAPQIVANS